VIDPVAEREADPTPPADALDPTPDAPVGPPQGGGG